jgi:putative phage-type endonuclease
MTAFDRDSGLGASEAPAALGLDPYASPTEVWMRKQHQGEPVEANLAMRIGNLLEEPVARLYAEASGHVVKRYRTACRDCVKAGTEYACERAAVRDPVRPWLYAHLDRVAWDDEGRYVVEIKTSGWPGEEWGDTGTDQVPLRVLVQVIVQMHVTGMRRAVVAALLWGRELRTYPITWDDAVAASVLARLDEFWQQVQDGSVPVHADHQQTGKALRRLYAKDNGLAVVANAADEALVETLVAARMQRLAAEAEEEAAKVAVQARLGDLQGLQWDGGSITWKTQQKASTPWRSVAEWVGTAAVQGGVMTKDEYDAYLAEQTTTESTRVFRVNLKRGGPSA